MTTLLEIKGITNKFGSKVVHDGISLTLKKNEILGLVGGSGSGKSVLLRTILGLHEPQKGKVLIEGVDIYSLSSEERLRVQNKWGVLFQNGALFSGLSVLDNVALPLREHTRLSAQAVENLAFLKLEMVGLEPDTAEKYPATLSGGMVTRAAMARAMALDPEILFLDEPTGALDAVAATALDELMLSLQKVLNLSILIITHDLDTLVTICDRIAMIADKKIEVGTLNEMLKSSNPEVHEYFSGPRMKAVLAKQGAKKVTMEKKANYFVVGLFVSLTLLGLVVFVIWLAGFHRTGDYDRYTVYFTDPVSGLDREGVVKYKGVTVGKILALRLDPSRSDLIKADIEVQRSAPIHGQTGAKIAIQGITGLNYLELITEATDKTAPQHVSGEKYPVLKGTGNALGAFLDELPKVSKHLQETLTAIDELSKSSAKTVDSIRALADKLKEDPSQVLHPPLRTGVEIPK